ncbi:MAG: hypothetical protein WCI82_04025, partial [Actinomycetes bacterium]
MSLYAHPLDPLSHAEQELIVEHARRAWKLEAHHLFAMLQLHEPTKAELASGKKLDRTARVTIWDRKKATVSEGLITTEGAAKEFKEIPGAKSPVTVVESAVALDVVRRDQSVKDALARRGINDITTVHMETWPIGAQIPAHLDDGRRLIWTPMWHQPTPDANFYAHPIHGLHAIVDIDAEEVVGLEDNADVPIPQTPGPYRESQTGGTVKLKELMIHQPDGASFEMQGWNIKWERWSFRIGFDQREGLVIHDVHFTDEG